MTQEQLYVCQFNRRFHFPMPPCGTSPTRELAEFRLRLIEEELKELEGALEEKNIISIAHELADVLYVIYGAALACGIDLSGPNILQPIESPHVPYKATINYHLKYLAHHYSALESSLMYSKALGDIMHDLLYLRFFIYTLAFQCGVDLEAVFAEVHRANMTKELDRTREDGKILKGDTYIPPDIEAILQQQKG